VRVPLLVALALATSVLSGCSGGGADETGTNAADAFKDKGVTAGDGKGVLLGVVVDDAIRPLPGAEVVLQKPSGGLENQTTDAQGRFAFGELDPGTYLLQASLLNYKGSQSSVEVKAQADDPDPRVARILLERLYSLAPYSVALHHEGFIQCGYDITVASSLCLNDYTHFVGPYTCTDCEHLLDRRSANFAVDAGWQTMIFEMDWEPTTQATSVEMSLTISHFPRSASHWYCQGAGAHPVLVRMEQNVTCENQQSEPEQVPPEGLPNMHMFGASNAQAGMPASMTFGQKFDVYSHLFYYGKPPEGWSFLAGDIPPF
jgi:hypothetical protein